MAKQHSEGALRMGLVSCFIGGFIGLIIVIVNGNFFSWAFFVFFLLSGIAHYNELNKMSESHSELKSEVVLYFSVGLAISALSVYFLTKSQGSWISHNVFHWYGKGGLIHPYEWDTDYNWLKFILIPLLLGGLVLGLYICGRALKLSEKKGQTNKEIQQVPLIKTEIIVSITPADKVRDMIRNMSPITDIEKVIDKEIMAAPRYFIPRKETARYILLGVLSKLNEEKSYPPGFKEYVSEYIIYFGLSTIMSTNNYEAYNTFLKNIEETIN